MKRISVHGCKGTERVSILQGLCWIFFPWSAMACCHLSFALLFLAVGFAHGREMLSDGYSLSGGFLLDAELLAVLADEPVDIAVLVGLRGKP